jgi:O-antigen/teichoic acid export membrane protein
VSAASKVLGGPAISRLKRRALSLGAAKAFDYAMQFLLPVVLVRTLDTVTFGEYRLLWLAVGTLIALATLNMPQSLYYYLPRSDAPTRRLFVHHTLIYLAVAGLIAGWAVSPLNPWLPGALAPFEKYGALMPAFVVLWVTAYMIEVLPIVEERIRLATGLIVAFSTLRVLLLGAGAFFAEDLALLLWLLVGLVLLKIGVQLAYIRRYHGLERPWLRLGPLWEHFRHAAPFGVSSALYTMRVQGDQWIAAALFSLQSFAALSIAAVFNPLVNVFRTSVNEAFLPSMSRTHAAGDLRGMLELNGRANLMVGTLLYPLLAYCFAFSHEIISLVYTEKYIEAATVMRVYIVGTACLVIEMGSIVLLLKQGGFATRVNSVLLALSLAVSFLGARTVGLAGAAMGSVLAIYLDRLVMLRRASALTGVPLRHVQAWGRLGLTAALAAAAGAAAWLAAERFLAGAEALPRLFLGAAVLAVLYLPWPLIAARRQA